MIWIKENDEIVGYVPMLKKEYSDDEILEMSKYCQSYYKGWSKLSSFVMHLQGISYAYISHKPIVDFFDAPLRLYDIKSDFYYECLDFDLLPYDIVKPYTDQVFDVFENLILYKVEHYPISDLKQKVYEMADYLSNFVDSSIISSVRTNFNAVTLSIASANAKNIENLFKIFSKNGLTLSHNLFQEADDAIIEKLKQKRDCRTGRLIKNIND